MFSELACMLGWDRAEALPACSLKGPARTRGPQQPPPPPPGVKRIRQPSGCTYDGTITLAWAFICILDNALNRKIRRPHASITFRSIAALQCMSRHKMANTKMSYASSQTAAAWTSTWSVGFHPFHLHQNMCCSHGMCAAFELACRSVKASTKHAANGKSFR